ncbi:hypothetical protein [Algoriphagus boritolerans]|uniref:3-dehydroquinate synthase family protein n=1 Tax=Algoriphagus boritolerans TaxID=308111 RepID=UPI003A0FF66B
MPHSELRSGYAEVLKHGLIRDKSYFEKLKSENWESQDWESLIMHSVGIKKSCCPSGSQRSGSS